MSDIVSILIPFYNAGDTIAKTLASVEVQTSQHWMVILINDGSTDASISIAQNFVDTYPGKSVLIQSPKQCSGPAVCRNLGLKYVEGLYVICLDADDWLEPFCIEQRIKVMKDYPEIGWSVFNQYEIYQGQKPPYNLFNKKVENRYSAITCFLKMEVAWQTMAPIWKTETLRKLGGFDETLFANEDPDLHLRALLDNSIQLKICDNLPPDSFYSVANKRGDKLLLFYKHSIESKLKFLKKIITYLPNYATPKDLKMYKKYLRGGYFRFINSFLLTRFKEHEDRFKSTTKLLLENGILSKRDDVKIKLIFKLFTNNSSLVKKLKLKGLIYKLVLSNNNLP